MGQSKSDCLVTLLYLVNSLIISWKWNSWYLLCLQCLYGAIYTIYAYLSHISENSFITFYYHLQAVDISLIQSTWHWLALCVVAMCKLWRILRIPRNIFEQAICLFTIKLIIMFIQNEVWLQYCQSHPKLQLNLAGLSLALFPISPHQNLTNKLWLASSD